MWAQQIMPDVRQRLAAAARCDPLGMMHLACVVLSLSVSTGHRSRGKQGACCARHSALAVCHTSPAGLDGRLCRALVPPRCCVWYASCIITSLNGISSAGLRCARVQACAVGVCALEVVAPSCQCFALLFGVHGSSCAEPYAWHWIKQARTGLPALMCSG